MTQQLEFDFTRPQSSLPQLWTPDDIFNNCDQNVVEQFKEDRRVERKRATVSQRDLADYVSMWANSNPAGGVIFIGVENNGQISCCKVNRPGIAGGSNS